MQLFLFLAVLLSAADLLCARQICCPDLGCYNNEPPFDGLPLPECPEKMGMNMKLYTRLNPRDGENITRNIIPSSFNGTVMTIFIAHGWTGSEQLSWMHEMKYAFLLQGDYNVIIAGWKDGAGRWWYPKAASNTRTAGGEIALVSNNIINQGKSSRALMYCVGFSLGAHVCGHAGHQGQFGRITGLDPAGPKFQHRNLSAGLNPSCADLVDVIHTDGRFFGTYRAMGHIDFFPNGGYSQPGCIFEPTDEVDDWEDFADLIYDTQLSGMLGCSHNRAHQFFQESILTPCFLVHQSFRLQYLSHGFAAESRSAVQSMGFNAAAYPGRGNFSLTTKRSAPFCRG